MNSKQFVSTAVCDFFERARPLRKFLGVVANFIHPSFERIPIYKKILKLFEKPSIVGIYLFVFIFLFVVQAIWAFVEQRFFPSGNILIKNFLDDWVDLINYVIICELYIILGIEFISKKTTIYSDLDSSSFLPKGEFILPSNNYSGFFGAVIVLMLATFASIGYTVEVNSYTHFYWFMKTPPPNVTFSQNGYYYLFINRLMMLFVIWVGANNFGLFQIAGVISKYLRKLRNDKDVLFLKQKFSDESLLKSQLNPFSELVLFAKGFVLVIALNLLLWKFNQPEIKKMYEISVLITAIFGIWIFALPRYYVQYQIFRIWEKIGKHEYKDLRMPWVVGISAFIDIILITIIIKVLLGEAISNLFNNLFS